MPVERWDQEEINQGDHALVQELIHDIIEQAEYLDTTDRDSVPCISIENLSEILKNLGIINEEEEQQMNKEVS